MIEYKHVYLHYYAKVSLFQRIIITLHVYVTLGWSVVSDSSIDAQLSYHVPSWEFFQCIAFVLSHDFTGNQHSVGMTGSMKVRMWSN